jgi:molybdate transport system substrate-binding protein
MKKRLLLALSFATLPLLASAQQLTVSAAASLTDAFKEIAPRFEAGKPGASLRFNFAASGVLLQQIAQGAPVDVFASADQETMNRGAERKLIATDTRRDFASNSLVLIAPLQSAPAIAALADLGRAEVRRIAVGKVASVPVGRYTQKALESAQLWAGLQPKLVFADNVRQVLDYVSRGEVEAGFVYRTDAELLKDKVRIAMTVGGHAPVTYPAAVVADSRQAALAKDFVAFLGSAEAQSILAKYGFGKP